MKASALVAELVHRNDEHLLCTREGGCELVGGGEVARTNLYAPLSKPRRLAGIAICG